MTLFPKEDEDGLQRVHPGVTVAQTRVDMDDDAPALARLELDETSANAAF